MSSGTERVRRVREMLDAMEKLPSVRAEDLAKRFGVSRRTIYRWLADARRWGADVRGERGRHGGLVLLERVRRQRRILFRHSRPEARVGGTEG